MLMISISESKKLCIKSDSIYVYTGLLCGFIAYFINANRFDIYCCYCLCFTSLHIKTLNKNCFTTFISNSIIFILLTLYSQYGVKVLFMVIVIVASTDIGAYFIGKGFGKTKFSETSPNKKRLRA